MAPAEGDLKSTLKMQIFVAKVAGKLSFALAARWLPEIFETDFRLQSFVRFQKIFEIFTKLAK